MPRIIKVGVLRGGPSSEYDVSLNTGGNVLQHLPEKYKKHDILLSKTGEWHLDGFSLAAEKIFRFLDVIFNALHGEFGEDGKVQQILDTFSVPYTGSGVFSSALAMNKILAKEAFKQAKIRVPRGVVIKKKEPAYDSALNIFQRLGPSFVAKPLSRGSSVGASPAHSFEQLLDAIENAFVFDDNVLVEEFIKGREATCGVVENFRGEQHYPLPVIEIIPPDPNQLFNYQVKYDGTTQEICPARFDQETKKEIEEIAKKAHQALGCRHYSRSDMIVSPNGIYLLEVNTLPGLTSESLLPKAAEAVGLSFPGLLDHLIKLALNR